MRVEILGRTRRRAATRAAGHILVAAAIIAAVVAAFWLLDADQTKRHAGPALLAATLGAVVGASELVSRYRDEPLQAVTSPAGGLYIGLNALVAALVYGLLIRYNESVFPGLDDEVMTSIVAGISAMPLLRIKFLTLKTKENEDFAVGLDAIVQTFLDAADAGVDRYRAQRRLEMVFDSAKEISVTGAARDFFTVSLAALQNVSDDDRGALTEVVDKVWEGPLPAPLKLQALCYGVLSLTGDKFFEIMMERFKNMPPEMVEALAAGIAAADAARADDDVEPVEDGAPQPTVADLQAIIAAGQREAAQARAEAEAGAAEDEEPEEPDAPAPGGGG